MEKISIAFNSKHPNEEWFVKAIKSAKSFDEMTIVVEYKDKKVDYPFIENLRYVGVVKDLTICEGFNKAINQTTGDWICSFCDDDWFNEPNLKELLNKIKAGDYDDVDIIHFPVSVTTGGLWGCNPIFTLKQLEQSNQLPHGSFFRRSVFKALGGYKIDEGADWNFWLRAKRLGCKFKYFDKPVYNFRIWDNSAFKRQLKALGGISALHRKVLDNA